MTGENIYEMSEADVKEKFVVPARDRRGNDRQGDGGARRFADDPPIECAERARK